MSTSCWPSGTLPSGARFRRSTHNKKPADPVHGSAVTSIAAAGMPPEPHERETVIVARPRLLGSRAHRMAHLTEIIRQRRTARTLRGDWSERDALLRQAEGTSLLYTVTGRRRHAASQSARTVHGRPRLEQRVKESQEGNVPPSDSARPGACARAGFRLPRGSAHALDGLRLSAPTHGTSVPLPGPKGLPDTGDAASARGNLAGAHGPLSARGSLASARRSVADAVRRVSLDGALPSRGRVERSVGAVLISPPRA
jgi:hypothetical protein